MYPTTELRLQFHAITGPMPRAEAAKVRAIYPYFGRSGDLVIRDGWLMVYRAPRRPELGTLRIPCLVTSYKQRKATFSIIIYRHEPAGTRYT